jgi:glycosyltransferase involved in cell wall biosynthesis
MKLAVFHMLPSGGGCRAVFQFLGGIAGRFEVTAHLPEGAHEACLPESTVRLRYPFPASRRLSGLRRLAAPVSLLSRLRQFDGLCRRIAGEINASADLALVHNSMVVAAPPLLRYLEVPSAYFCFEYPRHVYESRLVLRTGSRLSEVLLAPLASRERRIDRASVRAADMVITLSSYMRDRIRGIYGVDPEVVWPGVDSRFYSPGDPAGAVPAGDYVMSVGALWPFKGHDLAVKAVGLVPAESRPGLVVVADREYPGYGNALRETAFASGTDLDIRTCVGDDELRDLYRGARAVLCCAHAEPYGMVPLEAMACGCPVVAVGEGGFTDNVEDGKTGIIVPRDGAAFAAALAGLMTDERLRDRLTRETMKTQVCEYGPSAGGAQQKVHNR